MTTYTSPFTGQTISPSQVGYESIALSALTGSVVLQWPINGTNSSVVANIIDVTTTSTSYGLILPTALQVSVGQSFLINNKGSLPVVIYAVDGVSTVGSVPASTALYFWLTDNSTSNGSWDEVTFGAGTSSANANQLAGAGLRAVGTTLNQVYQESSVNSSIVLTSAYQAQFLVWATGVGTITLPTAASVGNGWFVMIRNGGSGIVTLTPSGTDTIDTNATQQLQLTESLVVVSNGVNGYSTFAYGRSNTFAYTQLAKTVTGGTATLTAVEYANVVQEYFGALTSNQIIILPSTVQIYYLNNQTTGSYSLTFKTVASGAAVITLPQNQTITVICDGTNVYSSQTAVVAGAITTLTLSSGSVSTPSLTYVGDTTTGLYHPTSGQLGVTLNGANAATFTPTGLLVPVGIGGGTF